MDPAPQACCFTDPNPDAASSAAIEQGFDRIADLSPELARLGSRLSHPSGAGGSRRLFLDAAATLLTEADQLWTRGRVLEALALEGLEARLIEQLVVP